MLLAAALCGCEAHTFLDPSKPIRTQRTPVVLPILHKLDVIDEPSTEPEGLSEVMPADLKPDVREYTMGVGDLVTITIFELIIENVESVQTRRVNELGVVRLPEVGSVKVSGLTPSQLEQRVADILKRKGKLKSPTVSVIVQESRQNTFSVIGAPDFGSTALGTYVIRGPNFRLLDAMALARGVPATIKTLYVIRPISLEPTAAADTKERDDEPAPDPLDLIDRAIDPTDPEDDAGEGGGETPTDVAAAVEPGEGQWVHDGTRWLRKNAAPTTKDSEGPQVAQRVIRVPYDQLLDGEMKFNLVIRPGDIIRVPPPVIGNVYIGGEISRPGTYQLPGDRDLTLKQLVYAAGNLSALAIPERVDLTRRIGPDREATVRVNLRAIFEGRQPDFFLKPNDTIHIGTNFWATPLAVIRNGVRATYGFGFVYDQNFADDDDDG